jgi:putative FmdB family regulatory protein
MPLYEFQCKRCGARTEVFVRRATNEVPAPSCPESSREAGHEMVRVVSAFVRHLTLKDKIAEAEAKFGKEVDAAMGPPPDVGKYARRYEQLAKDLPPRRD